MTRASRLMQRLVAADPVAGESTLSEDTLAARRTEILATPRPEPARRVRRGARRFGRFPIVGAIALAAAAATAVVVSTTGDPTPTASAAELLSKAADRIQTRPTLLPTLGQYYYRRATGVDRNSSIDTAGMTHVEYARVTHEIWIGPDGSGRIVRRDSSTSESSPAAAAIDELEAPGTMAVPFGDRTLTLDAVAALPTDPDRLSTMIRASASRNSHPLVYQELDLVAELLRNAPVSPQLGAALYRALARAPGIQALGERTDSLGRRGQAIGAGDGSGLRLELLIDPLSGELLADREVATDRIEGYAEAGDVAHEYTYVTRALVASRDERPRRP